RPVQDYALRILEGTHPESEEAPPMTKRYVRYGSSPRGAPALLLGAQNRGLMGGRYPGARGDNQRGATAPPRHRRIPNIQGGAEGIGTDNVIAEILTKTRSA